MTRPDSSIESTKELHESKERKPEMSIECCVQCGEPKDTRNLKSGDEVANGWPVCQNPSCVAFGQSVASAWFRRVALSRGAEPDNLTPRDWTVIRLAVDIARIGLEGNPCPDLSTEENASVRADYEAISEKLKLYPLPPRGEAETPTDTDQLEDILDAYDDALSEARSTLLRTFRELDELRSANKKKLRALLPNLTAPYQGSNAD